MSGRGDNSSTYLSFFSISQNIETINQSTIMASIPPLLDTIVSLPQFRSATVFHHQLPCPPLLISSLPSSCLLHVSRRPTLTFTAAAGATLRGNSVPVHIFYLNLILYASWCFFFLFHMIKTYCVCYFLWLKSDIMKKFIEHFAGNRHGRI